MVLLSFCRMDRAARVLNSKTAAIRGPLLWLVILVFAVLVA